MKAPAFDYVKPAHLEEVFPLLAEYGDEARLLAGGQSLLAALNLRLSEPSVLIDISGIDALRGVALEGTTLRIGALTTHSAIEASPLIAIHAPLLLKAAPNIAHRAIRNLGTIGGSIAYADPAAEWPTCMVALDAMIVVAGSNDGKLAHKGCFACIKLGAAGKIVSLQKPMCLNMDEADQLVAAAEAHDRPVKIFENFIFYPPVMKAKALIAEANPADKDITVTNTGDAVLEITKVETSCGCIIPKMEKMADRRVQPYEALEQGS